MAKATKSSDSATTKKRGSKTKPENGNGTKAAEQVTTRSSPILEEKIRTRAYELYLQRGGTGGSPEQDWLRAKEEICGQQSIA